MCRALSLVLFLLFGGVSVPASAQPSFGTVEERQTNVTSYFFHVFPGEATIRVNVWGTVGRPGVYEIGTQTALGELLSLAGGPLLQPLQDNTTREVFLRLYRTEGDARVTAYESDMETLVQGPGAYMALRDGDVIEVETQLDRSLTWRDTLTIAGTAAGLAAVVLQIVYITTR